MHLRWGAQTKDIRDGIAGGPLAIFDEEGNTLIISPLSEFMVTSNWHDRAVGGNVYWGLMGGIDEVPYHYTYMTVVCYAKGINKVGGKTNAKWAYNQLSIFWR